MAHLQQKKANISQKTNKQKKNSNIIQPFRSFKNNIALSGKSKVGRAVFDFKNQHQFQASAPETNIGRDQSQL